MAKVKRLCDHDVREIVMFQQYLADMQTMTNADFHCKYQEYEGLSDTELQAVLAGKEQP